MDKCAFYTIINYQRQLWLADIDEVRLIMLITSSSDVKEFKRMALLI